MTYANETFAVGKVTVSRDRGGSVSFVDKRGARVTSSNHELLRFIEAALEGSGEEVIIRLTEGTGTSTNLRIRGPV